MTSSQTRNHSDPVNKEDKLQEINRRQIKMNKKEEMKI